MKKNSLSAWWLAARPKTLSGALIPVVTASALAYAHGKFSLIPFIFCALFACLMQIAANFINDLYDFLKGSDREDRLGPERACAQGWISPAAMQIGIGIVLLLAAATGLALLWMSQAWWLLLIGVACIVFAFLYTTLLSYCGMGDLLVWVFFGFVPVAGTYYVQTGGWSPEVGWLSATCGLLIDTLLVLNNYRDRDQDRISGKRTLIVVFGEPFGRYFYLWQGILAYVCGSMLAFYGHMWAAILPMFYLLPHYLTWRKMAEIHEGRKLNRVLGFTSRNMLTYGLLMAAALYLSREWGN